MLDLAGIIAVYPCSGDLCEDQQCIGCVYEELHRKNKNPAQCFLIIYGVCYKALISNKSIYVIYIRYNTTPWVAGCNFSPKHGTRRPWVSLMDQIFVQGPIIQLPLSIHCICILRGVISGNRCTALDPCISPWCTKHQLHTCQTFSSQHELTKSYRVFSLSLINYCYTDINVIWGNVKIITASNFDARKDNILLAGSSSHSDKALWLATICLFSGDTVLQWNLSVTTTSLIKFITFDLFSNVF